MMSTFFKRLLHLHESVLMEAPLSRLMAAEGFLDMANDYDINNNGVVIPTLDKFVKTKMPDHSAQFGNKDLRFKRGSPLSEFSHLHIIHGKVILIYKIEDNCLKLYTIVKHDDYENKSAPRLANHLLYNTILTHIPTNAFEPKSEKEVLTIPDQKEVMDIIYQMVAGDIDIIRSFLQGDVSDFMEFMDIAIMDEYQSWKSALKNTYPDLAARVRKIAQQMGLKV